MATSIKNIIWFRVVACGVLIYRVIRGVIRDAQLESRVCKNVLQYLMFQKKGIEKFGIDIFR